MVVKQQSECDYSPSSSSSSPSSSSSSKTITSPQPLSGTLASKSSISSVKSKTYYGGEVITCLSSLLNQRKHFDNDDHLNGDGGGGDILKFEFIGADVKLKKSNLLQICNGTNTNNSCKQMRSVNFVDTVVIKEYPSLDFLLDELEQEKNFLYVNYLNYEKTLTRRLEQKMEYEEEQEEENDDDDNDDDGDKQLELEEICESNILLNKVNKQQEQREPSLDDVKAANTVNKMINKYKEMIESRAMLINGIKEKYSFLFMRIFLISIKMG